jgi:hypothetical protein
MRSRSWPSGKIVDRRMRLPQRGQCTVGIGNFKSAGRALTSISPYRRKPNARRPVGLSLCAQSMWIFQFQRAGR